jgi:hypothetical protein
MIYIIFKFNLIGKYENKKKYTLESCKEFAMKKGGECLSREYKIIL